MPLPEGDGKSRHLGGFVEAKPYPTVVDRWAVIVGISKYRHTAWNLKFADRDARALAELIMKPSGGAFEPEKIRLLGSVDIHRVVKTAATRWMAAAKLVSVLS